MTGMGSPEQVQQTARMDTREDAPDTKEANARADAPANARTSASATNKIAGMSRRSFVAGIVASAALVGVGGMKALPAEAIVRPPGGQEYTNLIARCIRCEKCVEVCPRKVIVPSHPENGIIQMRTPALDFSSNWCDFCVEENGGTPKCVSCCPTGALSLPEDASPTSTILGYAYLNTRACLAYKMAGCRFCFDACPYDAILLDSDNRPYLVPDRCNGCGACESVCVSLQETSLYEYGGDPYTRAITVKPLSDRA